MQGEDPLLAELEADISGFVLVPLPDSPVRGRIPTGSCTGVLPDPLPAGQLLDAYVDWDRVLDHDQVGTLRDTGAVRHRRGADRRCAAAAVRPDPRRPGTTAAREDAARSLRAGALAAGPRTPQGRVAPPRARRARAPAGPARAARATLRGAARLHDRGSGSTSSATSSTAGDSGTTSATAPASTSGRRWCGTRAAGSRVGPAPDVDPRAA